MKIIAGLCIIMPTKACLYTRVNLIGSIRSQYDNNMNSCECIYACHFMYTHAHAHTYAPLSITSSVHGFLVALEFLDLSINQSYL